MYQNRKNECRLITASTAYVEAGVAAFHSSKDPIDELRVVEQFYELKGTPQWSDNSCVQMQAQQKKHEDRRPTRNCGQIFACVAAACRE
jgi:hypothetical protein